MASNTSPKSRTGEKSRARSSSNRKKVSERKVTKRSSATKPDKGVEDDDGHLVIVLDPVLVINKASGMHEKLAPYLEKNGNEITIDASLVEMIDTAMIQLLYSLVTDLKSKNVGIIWRSPSLEFVSRVRSLGLAERLGIEYPVEG